MQELDDSALLREYVERDSQEAFTVLVARHVNKVYSVALRMTGNSRHAEEITQAVFVILARKCRTFSKRVVVSGWLYHTARLTAVTFIRTEIRRVRREQEAHMQTLLNGTEPVWRQIAPFLDAAMARLNEPDRHAIVLRFFDGKSMREVGEALGTSEDAAKMRVNRALQKLRTFFTKRGVTLSAAAIAAAVSANSAQAAPVGLVKTISAVAVAKGAAISTSTLTLVKGTMKMMTWLKMKWGVIWGTTIVVAGVATTAVLATNTPSETQLRQLFDSTTRELPEKLRVVSLRLQEQTPPSAAEVKRSADLSRKIEERITAGMREPDRAQQIESNVQLMLASMAGKYYYRIQEWKSGESYREDSAVSLNSLDEAAQKKDYDVTRINYINPTNGTASMREIMYAIKSFRTREGGARYTQTGAWNGFGIEERVILPIAITLASNDSIRRKAKDARQKPLLDEAKLKQLAAGENPMFKATVDEVEVDGQARLVFEFKPSLKGKLRGEAMTLIECEKTNFNRITCTEVRSASGEIQLSSTRSDFDAQDFPHRYRVIENGDNGYTTNTFTILEADLHPQFSDSEVFDVQPAKDFGVVEDVGGRPVVKTYPGGVSPTKIVDVSDIVADFNNPKPSRLWVVVIALAVLSAGLIVWRKFRA